MSVEGRRLSIAIANLSAAGAVNDVLAGTAPANFAAAEPFIVTAVTLAADHFAKSD